MNKQIKNRIKRTLIIAAIGLTLGVGIGWLQIQTQTASVIHKDVEPAAGPVPVAGIQVGGSFTLTDHNGQEVTERNFSGGYKLIYFGFTYCPAICPTELQKISKVLNILGDDSAEIQPLFITVDPERDTAEVMKDYVSLFHPRLIGLTGNYLQIEDVLKKYRIFARKVQDPEMSDYTMDHSSFIYLMSPDDKPVGIYRIKDSAEFMVEDIRAKIL